MLINKKTKLVYLSCLFFFFADPKNDPIRDSDPRNDPNRDFFDPLHPYRLLVLSKISIFR